LNQLHNAELIFELQWSTFDVDFRNLEKIK